MKLWKKILTSVLAAAMMVSVSAGAVLAAQSYTYTVTFYAGNQGSFSGVEGLTVNSETAVIQQEADKIVISGLQAGDEVGLNAQAAVTLDASSKYYVQGLRLSGRDNDTVEASVFIVKDDADYVIAYGIKGNQVSYTVNYTDNEGNELAESEVFYGNIGDKPVIAYKYIEGYVPEALGLTKTLSSNAEENVFTFEYNPIPTVTVEESDADAGDQDQDQDQDADADQNQESSAVAEPDTEEETTEESGQQPEESQQPSEEENESQAQEEESEEESIIVDLDEEDVPLAPGGEEGGAEEADRPLKTYITIGAVSLIVLLAAIVIAIVIKKRK